MDYNELKKYVDDEVSIRQIARNTGKSFTTVRYWMRKFGLFYTSPLPKRYGGGGRKAYSKEVLEAAVQNALSYSDIFINLGIKVNGGSYSWMKNLLKKFEIEVPFSSSKTDSCNPNFIAGGKRASLKRIQTLYSSTEDISNGRRVEARKLRSFLLFKEKKEECEVCGLTEWGGKKIRLDIHHKDGNCYNNHLENLQFICPNCHRQETIVYKENSLLQGVVHVAGLEPATVLDGFAVL